jgi:hypothetical protein
MSSSATPASTNDVRRAASVARSGWSLSLAMVLLGYLRRRFFDRLGSVVWLQIALICRFLSFGVRWRRASRFSASDGRSRLGFRFGVPP